MEVEIRVETRVGRALPGKPRPACAAEGTTVADWPRERSRRPQATNPHLLIASQTYRHPASPQTSSCTMRAAFDPG